jgi:hypothetical protein
MKLERVSKWMIVGLLVILPLLAFMGSQGSTATVTAGSHTVSLQPPALVNVAQAAPLQQTSTAFTDEAGIALYFQKPGGITLSNEIRALYRTIETESGQDYIIGQMQISDTYDDQHDAHVYISSSGWVVAYYQRDVPTSKIIDWNSWDPASSTLPTKLETVLTDVISTIGAGTPTLTYYHFGFPNANRMTLAADYQHDAGSDTFTITLPASFNYDVGERSWAVAINMTNQYFGYWSKTSLLLSNTQTTDGTVGRVEAAIVGWHYAESIFETGDTNLLVGTDQTITVSTTDDDGRNVADGYGGVAVVYQDNS